MKNDSEVVHDYKEASCALWNEFTPGMNQGNLYLSASTGHVTDARIDSISPSQRSTHGA
jgi:hypothetical protein